MKMNDPMENQYTSPPSTIDLTRKKPNGEASSLDSLSGKEPVKAETSSQAETPVAQSEKKIISAEVVQGVNFDPKTVTAFDPTSIIPRKEKPVMDQTTNTLFSQLDAAVEREKAEITRRHKEFEEKMYEDYIEKQDDEDDETVEQKPTTKQEVRQDDNDLDDDLDDDGYNSGDSYSNPVGEEKHFSIPAQDSTGSASSNISDSANEEKELKPIKEEKKAKEEDSHVRIVRTVSEYDDAEFEKDFSDDDDDDFDQKSNRPTDEEIQERERKEAEEIMNGLKEAAQEGFASSIFDKVDLRQFSIAKSPIKASSIIVHQDEGPKADWVLYESGKCIAMSALSGPELIQLDPQNSNRNRMNALKDAFKILYNHIIDSKKPSFEKWMMQTKYNDLDHIYFCAYKATFGSNNYLSYRCNDPDCEHIFMKTHKFEDLVRYKDDSVKKKVEEIMSQSTDNGIIKYNVDLVQASNTYVFGMRTPSLYNVAMENAGLSNAIIDKYGDMINIINYIDSVYSIDHANMELVPIAIPQPKDNDPVKGITKKIKTIYRILRLLNSDEYYTLRSYVLKAEEKASNDISYFIPEATCPECGKKIEEITDMTANALLFTRHHLGAFASM